LTDVAASAGTPECGLHAGERVQTGSWCAGARDEIPLSTEVLLRELVTPYGRSKVVRY
jgi:hypothetical protein